MNTSDLRPAYHLLWCLLAPAAWGAPLQLRVLDVQGRPVAGTVVTLRSSDAALPPAAPIDAVLDQVEMQFEPHVLVIPTGSKVRFPNSDRTAHQVYSFSPARRFQLPLYNGAPYPPVDFATPGVVTLGCNIHDQMRAYIFVVDAQHYGRTGADGRWRAAEVVPGSYRVQVWHPLSRDSRPVIDQTLELGAAAAGELTLRLAAPLKLRPMSQVPANWDAY